MSEQDIIYLDNAATTFPKPEVVYKAMDSIYRQFGGNAGRGANPLARKAAALVDETRALVADWLQAPHVVFTPSATIALNTVILGARLRAGDVVYISPFEHNSVLRPIEHLRKTVGIQVNVIPFDKLTFDCRLEALERQFLLEPPAMVCMSQVSNVIGLLLPVNSIARMAKECNRHSIIIVDGAQAAGLLRLDMNQIDAMAFSGHKSLYGPYGIAGIAFGNNWRPEPLIHGGTGTVSESIEMPEVGPSRFEPGSHNVSAVAGLNAAVKWLNETGRDSINEHIDSLVVLLIELLGELPNLVPSLPNDINQHYGIVSFSIVGVRPQSVENLLGAKNIAVRSGLHCAPWAHGFLDTLSHGGNTRMSVGYFSTKSHLYSAANELRRLCQ